MSPPQRSPPSAAKRALDEVIAEERRINARRITLIRLVATALGALFFVVLDPSQPEIAVSRTGSFAYFAVAAVIAALVFAVPRLVVASAYAIALIDVPLLSLIHHLQLGPLGELRYHNVPANLVMMSTLVVASALSMSVPVIVATGVTALASMLFMLYRCDFPLLPILLTGIGAPSMAVLTGLLVLRIRHLVTQARSRDLLGKYVLGERLGVGGMAEVFLATYCPEGGFERKVAVKRILPSRAQDATAIALFRREAELGASLAHPNLVHVLDFGADGTTFFLAMELVDGCSLQHVVAAARTTRRPLELKVVTYVAWCMAEALDHLHEHVNASGTHLRLVHRDINPPNVLVSFGGDVKIADFGIVRDVDAVSLTAQGLMRGKLAYAAPEQVMGEPFDGRADLFALGLTLWELLTNERLFRGDSDVSVLRAVLELSIPLVHLERPDVSPAFAHILRGLLVRDVKGRTASARVLIQQLSALEPEVLDIREGRRLLAAWVSEGMKEKQRPSEESGSMQRATGQGPSTANEPTREVTRPPVA